MLKTNETFAAETAIALAKANIEKTDRWVEPEEVIDFVEKVYAFLRQESKGETDDE